jgi:hypothetical protein
MTLGDRLQSARDWRDGTFAPVRSGGHPTIFAMPRPIDVPRRIPWTYLEWAGVAFVVASAGVVAMVAGW